MHVLPDRPAVIREAWAMMPVSSTLACLRRAAILASRAGAGEPSLQPLTP